MLLDNYISFLDLLTGKIRSFGIDVSHLNLDHFGYQASSDQDYDRLKLEFEKIGKLLSEEIVGGRRVGIFEFFTSLDYRGYPIPAVELVAPKPGQVCPSALEHVEYVIDEDFESFISKYPNLPWDKSKINQPMFPMLTLKLDDNIQVKFHYKPVLEIIKDK
ncbi:MAG: VOC family protein [Patescibacteria group bacterium]